MKNEKLSSKISLNKVKFSTLNNDQLTNVVGGAAVSDGNFLTAYDGNFLTAYDGNFLTARSIDGNFLTARSTDGNFLTA